MPDSSDAHPAELDEILDQAWQLLHAGVHERRHGFHLPVVATTDHHGRADARTVVLQSIDRDLRRVTCHTDARSPKAAHLQRTPWASWVFYDADARVQVRLAGPMIVTSPDECERARDAWERTDVSGRRCYLGPHAPSAPTETPSANLPDAFLARNPTLEESRPGVANFRLVTTTIARLEWLRLRFDGHRRAGFTWEETGAMTATWLEP